MAMGTIVLVTFLLFVFFAFSIGIPVSSVIGLWYGVKDKDRLSIQKKDILIKFQNIMKTKSLVGILMVFLCVCSFASCDHADEDVAFTPEFLYQTSWRGIGHCEAWPVKGGNLGIGIQFIDTQKGKVNWESYQEIDITYTIEGKYITFNKNALYLGGAPWVIKSFTNNHITIVQNEASPDKEKIATIELERVN